jgi:Tfp pilus assembly protein PilO
MAGDYVQFLSATAQSSGITGTKLKAITNLPPVKRDVYEEKGYSIELAGIDRQSLTRFLVDVETLRPSLRTRELRIRRFSETGEIAAANAVIVYHEKKDEKAPR